MTTHIVIPDCQVRPGDNLNYLYWIGSYVAEVKPDVIINLGDFADMPSLSSYDVGKKSFEGRRYTDDVDIVTKAMDIFMIPILREQSRLISNRKKKWNPRLILTLGNHEHRIDRAIENDRKLDGLISKKDLEYEKYWEVIPFLEPIVVDGICYCHYMTSGSKGLAVSTARLLITKKHMSCIVGHQQGRDVAYDKRADGKRITSIIAGSCLAPHHKVLTSDLRYVALGSIKVGDELVSFDEHLGMSSSRSRRFKTGKVTNLRTSEGELFKVTLSNGKEFITTRDHKWLTKNCLGVTKWQETRNLTVNGNKGYGTKVSRVLPEWDEICTKDAGWLSGMYDGEGSLYARETTGGYCTQLSISQCPVHNPLIVEKLHRIHHDLGFSLGSDSPNGVNCRQWRIKGGQSEIARLLGSVRPERLLNKFKPEALGRLTTQYNQPLDSIISVSPYGYGEYVEIEIDAATMVVEGYPHHNCYEHDESYMSHQDNKHWRGIIRLSEINDGEFDEMFISLNYLKKKYDSKK